MGIYLSDGLDSNILNSFHKLNLNFILMTQKIGKEIFIKI